MAGGKQSPRQKMINLMYLVFIAMLAMQIGREVLRSFDRIDQSLSKSNNLTDKNNADFLAIIQSRAKSDPQYVATLDKANIVVKTSEDLVKYIDQLKGDITTNSGLTVVEAGKEPDYSSLSNQEASTKLFFDNEETPSAKGKEFIAKIIQYNNFLKANGGSAFQINVNDVVNGEEKKPWLNENFYEQPMIASKTTLTKIQSDIKTAEGNIMRNFLTTKMIDDIEVNTFKGIVASPGYLRVGQQAQTFAALGAFDNNVKGTATVNGRSYPVIDGKATIPLDASSPGTKTISGSMSFVDGKGKQQNIALDPMTYEVVAEVIKNNDAFAAAVQADKMNVFYVGVANPITASVSGVEPSSISISGSGVSNSGGGKGVVRPGAAGSTINVSVSGKTSSGKVVSKSFPFRVKSIPKPEGQVRGKTVVSMPASSLRNATVEARIPDFEFDVNVSVTGFTVKVPGKPAQSVSGSSLSGSSAAASAKPGDVVTIFNISAVASGGIQVKEPSNVIIQIQ